ncbi:hypothetical protein [Confluentibacter flavum]|uniref:Uncharacterized protein n=1 Tax=Confluentibacter flavum TaxID=1909700 RepID=A0A2N3HPG6_9FLAO|nr:hypothetical protein [Confluentibacter flavum]PKQ46754.1 hypothetical protein CSW08_01225 [Confluentibacter flavum]
MTESEKILIDNILIDDGINKFNTEQVYNDKSLYKLANQTINYKLLQPKASYLIDKINLEKAVLVIKTDSQHKKNVISIQNASAELTNEFDKSF